MMARVEGVWRVLLLLLPAGGCSACFQRTGGGFMDDGCLVCFAVQHVLVLFLMMVRMEGVSRVVLLLLPGGGRSDVFGRLVVVYG